MGPFTRLIRWLRVIRGRKTLNLEMDEELEFHLQMATEENVQKGMSPREARRQALIAFGGVERFKEKGREAWGGQWVDDLLRDLRYADRSLRHRPAFSAASVLVLGIGVGSVSLMFSILNAVVLQPLPFPHPNDLIWVWAENAAGVQNSIAYEDYLDYVEGAPAFRSLATYMRFRQTRILTGGDEAEQVTTYRVSANFFSTLGVPPLLGRGFLPSEELAGAARVTVLSHGFWQRRFGGDPELLNTTISMDGEAVQIVGVMPPELDVPAGAEAWLPLERDAAYAQGRGEDNFFVLGRLSSEASLAQAQAQMNLVAQNIADTYPEVMAGWRIRLVTLHERLFGDARTSILILTLIVSLVPLVACANVASLFMTRAVARRPELAARLALGASRWRVVRHILTESFLVAVGGAAVGLAMAYVGATVLRSYAPAVLPRLDQIGIDGKVLAVTLLTAFLLVPLFGLIPARKGTELQINEVSRGSHGTSASRRDSGFRGALAVAQVAFSLMLLAGSGLLIRSHRNLQGVDTGLETDHLLTFQTLLPSFKYPTPAEMEQAWLDLSARLEALPGVSAVGFSDRAPLSGGGPTNTVHAAERPPLDAATASSATRRFVSVGYFEALGISLTSGRLFDDTDRFETNPVVVINEALARQYFPGEDPVGRTLVLEWTAPMNLEILGVVADVREAGLALNPPAVFYLPVRWDYDFLYVQVRSQGEPLTLAGTVAQATRRSDPDIILSDVQTLEGRIAASLFEPRFRSAVVTTFAGVALILCLIGLYGVLGYYVRERRHEISVRLALGASHGEITRWVMALGMRLVGMGIILGIAGVLAVGKVVGSVLYGVESTDPLTLVAVSASVALVGMGACALPAFRVQSLRPAEALKVE